MIDSSAIFSECRTWRYELRRRWGEGRRFLHVCGLNPSTADETRDDPTIRRCIGYAKDWGYDGLLMTNLFAYRSTDPTVLPRLRPQQRQGPFNLAYIADAVDQTDLTVCAWGTWGAKFPAWVREVALSVQAAKLHCLGANRDGSPKHPLYLPKRATPEPWSLPIL